MKNNLGIILIGLVLTICTISYITNYNYGNRTENQLIAEYTNLENILAQYSLKVSESAQVPAMYRDDLKDVVVSEMVARQGEGGSKATFQWFKEHDINIDSNMYLEIMNIIRGGRNKYTNAQTRFIETKQSYLTNLGYLWTGMWLSIAGYPKIDLDKYVIISTEDTKAMFETKIDKGLTLR